MALLQQLPTTTKTGWPWNEEINPNLYAANKSWEKISIVTPSYNQGEFIEETIRSILLQNYPNLELIIIDGGSQDNTVEILKKYDKWLTYWVSEKDKGQSDAINKGIAKMSGDIFNWVNSDDVIAKNALLHIGTAFQDANTKAITGKQQYNKAHGSVIQNGTHIHKTLGKTMGEGYINQPSTYFQSEFVKAANGVTEALHYTMDVELCIKFWLTYGSDAMVNIPELLSFFRYHEASKTSNAADEFNYDKARIFYSIAKQIELKAESDKLQRLYPKLADDQYSFQLENGIMQSKREAIKSAINYMLFYKFYNTYYWSANLSKQYKSLQSLGKTINADLLENEDSEVFKKLLFKLNYFTPFIMLFRKIKNELS